MSTPVVSYIVAAYNHEQYVEALISSILEQTYANLELIVIDDGSTDGTYDILQRMAQSDFRIRLYTQSNQGVVTTRNRGMKYARGSFVSVVDSDDLLPVERTQDLLRVLMDNPHVTMVYGNAQLIDRNGVKFKDFFDMYPPRKGEFSQELFASYCFVPAISVMFRRESFEASGPFWGPGPNADYLKWIELGMLGDIVCLKDKVLGYWRIHSHNTSRPGDIGERIKQYEQLKLALEQLAYRYPDLAYKLGQKRLSWRYSRCHLMAGFYAAKAENWKEATEQFDRAIEIYPSLLNILALCSTLPIVREISHSMYLSLGRKIL